MHDCIERVQELRDDDSVPSADKDFFQNVSMHYPMDVCIYEDGDQLEKFFEDHNALRSRNCFLLRMSQDEANKLEDIVYSQDEYDFEQYNLYVHHNSFSIDAEDSDNGHLTAFFYDSDLQEILSCEENIRPSM